MPMVASNVAFVAPGLEGDADALDNFAGVCADHVYAQDFVSVPVDDHFHQGFLIVAGQCVLEAGETGLVNLDVCVFLSGLFLGQADRAQVWLAEDAGGYVAVIHAA